MPDSTIIIRPQARTETVILDQPGKILYIFFTDHQKSEELQLEFLLRAPGAELTLIGFDLGTNHAVTIRSRVVHDQPHTISHTHVKSLLSGDASSSYKGVIHLQKTAQNSSATFEHRTLLLSPQAHGQAEPILEIEANQVRAKHAATISTLDPHSIYYLQTRGLNTKETHKALTLGFLTEMLKHIPRDKHREIQQQLEDHIHSFSYIA